MRKLFRAATMLAMFAPVVAVAQAKPVVAVLYFDNNSFGKDAADYNGVGKGIAEMLVTDMASNPALSVVERERIQSLLVEQNLTKEKAIAPETAIRLGRIVGAQYMVTGGFMSDGRGNFVLTSRVINVETSQISNPTRIDSKGDDVLGLIAQLSKKLNSEMKLPALRVGDATPAGQSAQPASNAAASPAPANVVPVKSEASAPAKSEAPAPKTQVAQSKPQKMDIKTAMLFSKALEEEDAGNSTKAAELYRHVLAVFPGYQPAEKKLAKLQRG